MLGVQSLQVSVTGVTGYSNSTGGRREITYINSFQGNNSLICQFILEEKTSISTNQLWYVDVIRSSAELQMRFLGLVPSFIGNLSDWCGLHPVAMTIFSS